MKPYLRWSLALLAALVAGGAFAFKFSPWPMALLIRHQFDKEGERVSRALVRHLPTGVAERLDQRYDPADGDAYLDVFYPEQVAGAGARLPCIVWVHGGGWISGSKDQIANYLRILAARGYVVVGVDYSIAPGARYPTPLRQVMAALDYLQRNAERFNIDPARIILAGDSGGAHIAAQVANLAAVPDYARAVGVTPTIDRARIVGLILHCGAYDVGAVNLEGGFGTFLRTVLWSYSGHRQFMSDTLFATASVINYLTPAFPPAFISAGNADPLLSQSRAFAAALACQGVVIDTLFYPDSFTPPLPHEYQFNLDTDAGRLALERALAFAARVPRTGYQ
jgi:acetyl esterase/lipase